MSAILCEKCNSPILHEWRKDKKYIKNAPLRFCSKSCANSKTPSAQQKAALSIKMKSKAYENSDNVSRKYGLIECKNCLNKFNRYYPSAKFCSQGCWKNYHKTIRNSRQNYKIQCAFKFNVYDYPDYFDLTLLSQYGWYSPTNKECNLNGVSRDHKLSISDGFEQKIDPNIIAHPANCCLVQHVDNQKKHRKSSITLEQLLEEITKFNLTYL